MSRAERRERKKRRREERLLASGGKWYYQAVKPPAPPKPATARAHPPTGPGWLDVLETEPPRLLYPEQAWPTGRVVSQSTGQVVDPPQFTVNVVKRVDGTGVGPSVGTARSRCPGTSTASSVTRGTKIERCTASTRSRSFDAPGEPVSGRPMSPEHRIELTVAIIAVVQIALFALVDWIYARHGEWWKRGEPGGVHARQPRHRT